ncbi:MAG: hypothetical protein AAF687_00355 [Pseudomonadota bacterium]
MLRAIAILSLITVSACDEISNDLLPEFSGGYAPVDEILNENPQIPDEVASDIHRQSLELQNQVENAQANCDAQRPSARCEVAVGMLVGIMYRLEERARNAANGAEGYADGNPVNDYGQYDEFGE